jgi:hypothetical protein
MIPDYPTGYACSLIGPPGKHVRFHVDKVEERNQPHDKPGAEDRNRTFHRLPLSRAL